MSKALAEQIAQRNRQRDAERAELAAVAMQYRSDASALVQAEQAARVARAERKKAVQEDLNKQLALKSAHQSGHRGMSTTELRLNKNLLQKVRLIWLVALDAGSARRRRRRIFGSKLSQSMNVSKTVVRIMSKWP